MLDQSEDQVQRFREALLDLCTERGYKKLKLKPLLERAGRDGPAFHRHYADLDACFAAVLNEIYAEFFALAQEAVAGQSGWRDRMRATAYALLRFLRRDERVANLAAVGGQPAGDASPRPFLGTFERLRRPLPRGK